MKKLSDKQKIEIVEKYKTGKFTYVSLSKLYNVAPNSIRSLLNIRKIKKIDYDRSEANRKYNLDQTYFDQIDTEDKAYFLGLLYADGTNKIKTRTVTISLIDEEILLKFNSYLKSNKPLSFLDYNSKNKKYKNQYRIDIHSKRITEKLNEFGCVPNKTFVLEFPNEKVLSKDLIRHFIRGYYDGDGGLYSYTPKAKPNSFRMAAHITSTPMFISKMDEIIKKELGIKTCVYIKDSRINCPRVFKINSHRDCIKFLDWLYKDATIFLKRKHDKYLKILSTIEERKNDRL